MLARSVIQQNWSNHLLINLQIGKRPTLWGDLCRIDCKEIAYDLGKVVSLGRNKGLLPSIYQLIYRRKEPVKSNSQMQLKIY